MAIRNTRAKIRLTATQIHEILDLPDSLQVLYVAAYDPPGVTVVVHGDALDEVPEDCEPPFLRGALTRDRVIVHGKVYSRWGWSPTDGTSRTVTDPSKVSAVLA